jgi:hypothetical protein
MNPLHTTLLLGSICDLAFHQGHTNLVYSTSSALCDRFFLKTPTHTPIVPAKGITLFIDDDKIINMNAIQSYSPLVVLSCVKAFIQAEVIKFRVLDDSQIIKSDSKTVLQFRLLSSLKSTALMSYLSVLFDGIEQSLRLITLGTNLVMELLKLETSHCISYVYPHVITLVSLLRSIPSKHWSEDDFEIHSQLLVIAAQYGLHNHDTLSGTILFDEIPEIMTTLKDNLDGYHALLSLFKQHNGLLTGQPLLGKIQTLLTLTPETRKQTSIWLMTSDQRTEILKTSATSLLEPKLSTELTQ